MYFCLKGQIPLVFSPLRSAKTLLMLSMVQERPKRRNAVVVVQVMDASVHDGS